MHNKNYVEINLDNLAYNTKTLTSTFNEYKYYFGVVKGNGYGHGEYIVNTLIDNGVNYLAVTYIDEALQIRQYYKDIPILCLLPIDIEDIDTCIKNNITILVHCNEYAEQLLNTKLYDTLKIHFKIDSGMSRLGFNDKNDLKNNYDKLSNKENIIIEGIFTHMATSGINDQYWDLQLKTFKEITSLIDLNNIPIVHIDRSLTMMCHEKINIANGVRLGIAVYGFNPLPVYHSGLKNSLRQIRNNFRKNKYHISKTNPRYDIKLLPSFSLYSEVIQVKKIKKDSVVGYGATYKAEEDMYLACLPIGYSDGLSRKYSGAFVAINKKRYQIIGSINMNIITIKVDDSVKIGDRVEIFGDIISIKEASNYIGTNAYELLTDISDFIPRRYIKNDKVEFTKDIGDHL